MHIDTLSIGNAYYAIKTKYLYAYVERTKKEKNHRKTNAKYVEMKM